MDVEITELEKIDADRVDGVGSPANGIKFILMKQVEEPAEEPPAEPELDRDAAKALAKAVLADLTVSPAELFKAVGKRGQVDEAPDIDLGNQIIALLGQAIAAEAQEVAAGNAGEVCDIQELACALQAVRCWRDGEQAVSLGDVMPASMLMQSAAKGVFGTVEAIFSDPEVARCVYEEVIAKAKHSAEDRRRLAEQGKALDDGSYPIADKEDLHSAAVLARSGHGDAAAAKRLIARRAKELGVANPLDDADDTSKSQIADEGTSVDTETQTGDLTEVVKAAVTEATAPLMKRVDDLESSNQALRDELAKVKATPVPGGPRMTALPPAKAPDGIDHAAKAAEYEATADRLTDSAVADQYRKLAAQERAKITVA